MNSVDVPHSLSSAPLFPTKPYSTRIGGLVLHESLGSWLFRFRTRNGFRDFSGVFIGTRFTHGRSKGAIDAPDNFHAAIAAIATAAWMTPQSIQRLMLGDTLMALKGNFSGRRGQWLLHSSMKRKLGSLMQHAVCPICIVESPESSWMQSWRLAVTTQCPIHNVLLLETCPACHSQFVIHNGRACPLDRCEICHLPFLQMPFENCGHSLCAPAFAVNVGRNTAITLPVAQAFEHHWWSGVHKMLTLIEDPKRARELGRATLPAEFAGLLSAIENSPRQHFEYWPIRRRHHALRFVAWMTECWPERFLGLLTKLELGYRSLPFLLKPGSPWTDKVFNDYSSRMKHFCYPLGGAEKYLICSPTASLSIPVFRCGNKSQGEAKPKLALPRWSLDRTVRIVHMIDARVLVMRGTVKTKAKFLRRALTIVRGHGAQTLPTGDEAATNIDSTTAQVEQSVHAWEACLRGFYGHIQPPRTIDTLSKRLSEGFVSKWLASECPHPQTSLFGWTNQGLSDQPSVVS